MQQRILLFRRLSLYLNSGTSLLYALEYLAINAKLGEKAMLVKIQESLTRGERFSQALSQFSHAFDQFTIGFIEAGETSGTLAPTLAQLAALLEKRKALRQKLASALMYPIIVLVAAIGMSVFMFIYIFPKILPVLESFHTRLPLATQLLIGTQNFVSAYWPYLFVVLSLIIGLGMYFSRIEKVRLFAESFILKTPVIQTIYKQYSLATFLRTLTMLFESGAHILPSLTLSRATLSSRLYSHALAQVEESIVEGKHISEAVAYYPQLFPSILIQLLSVGEETGTLRENLHLLADNFNNEFDDSLKNLSALIEPTLMLCMGLVVGFIALAIITPIYSVTSSLSTQ